MFYDDYAYYTYGIGDIIENKENDSIVDVHFGNGKMPVHIFKEDLVDFYRAIIPEEEREDLEITDKELFQYGQKKVKGRAICLVTTFKNFLEYSNGGQNGIVALTGIKIDGRPNLEEGFDYKHRKPRYNDLYPGSRGR